MLSFPIHYAHFKINFNILILLIWIISRSGAQSCIRWRLQVSSEGITRSLVMDDMVLRSCHNTCYTQVVLQCHDMIRKIEHKY